MSSIDLSKLDLSTASASDIAALAKKLAEAEANAKTEAQREFTELATRMAEFVAAHGTYSDTPGRLWAGFNHPSVKVEMGGQVYSLNVSLTDLKRRAEKVAVSNGVAVVSSSDAPSDES